MRHRTNTTKLARTTEHHEMMLVNLALSLIDHHRIKTTVAKAKALRPFVEKLITKARRGTANDRRICSIRLKANSRYAHDIIGKLFAEVGPANATREGGYTRILKLGPRQSDSAPMAFIEFVETISRSNDKKAKADKSPATEAPAAEAKPAKKAPAKKAPKAAAEAPAEEAETKPAKKPRAKKAADKKEGE